MLLRITQKAESTEPGDELVAERGKKGEHPYFQPAYSGKWWCRPLSSDAWLQGAEGGMKFTYGLLRSIGFGLFKYNVQLAIGYTDEEVQERCLGKKLAIGYTDEKFKRAVWARSKDLRMVNVGGDPCHVERVT